MKKFLIMIALFSTTFSLYSCRETEMNTDGDTEVEDRRIEDSGEEIEN